MEGIDKNGENEKNEESFLLVVVSKPLVSGTLDRRFVESKSIHECDAVILLLDERTMCGT
jgi:hypothetical protein